MFAQVSKFFTSKGVVEVAKVAAEGAMAAVVIWAVGRFNIKI